jgi:hypothetical protein
VEQPGQPIYDPELMRRGRECEHARLGASLPGLEFDEPPMEAQGSFGYGQQRRSVVDPNLFSASQQDGGRLGVNDGTERGERAVSGGSSRRLQPSTRPARYSPYAESQVARQPGERGFYHAAGGASAGKTGNPAGEGNQVEPFPDYAERDPRTPGRRRYGDYDYPPPPS